ncbi:hypothetical protein ACIQPR_47925 [Streptomyces sp. NPDC091280]|uniref:hypothetical protein n=1 Tax=Streptomyces sp. NPDC091280 TaxID=3365984 RepID=UPI00382CB734
MTRRPQPPPMVAGLELLGSGDGERCRPPRELAIVSEHTTKLASLTRLPAPSVPPERTLVREAREATEHSGYLDALATSPRSRGAAPRMGDIHVPVRAKPGHGAETHGTRCVPVEPAALARGAHIVGGTGTGKSSLLRAVARDVAEQRHAPALRPGRTSKNPLTSAFKKPPFPARKYLVLVDAVDEVHDGQQRDPLEDTLAKCR